MLWEKVSWDAEEDESAFFARLNEATSKGKVVSMTTLPRDEPGRAVVLLLIDDK
jgi:hypothetical protein